MRPAANGPPHPGKGGGRHEARVVLEEQKTHLLSGKQRHVVGGGVGKTGLRLRPAHGVRERPASRHDDGRPSRASDELEHLG